MTQKHLLNDNQNSARKVTGQLNDIYKGTTINLQFDN